MLRTTPIMRWSGRTLLCVLPVAAAVSSVANANPPAPPNDTLETAIAIDSNVPTIVHGTTVLADDTITSTPLPAPVDDVDGPDVFYTFTPDTTDTYRFQLLPWQGAPLRSSDRRFTLYVLNDEAFIAGSRAAGSARPVHIDVALTSGTEYTFGVDYNASSHDNFPFTLIVDRPLATNPDECGSSEAISPAVPTAVMSDIDGAFGDFQFVQELGLCAVSGSSPTSADGIDHVYTFTPAVSGDYAFELVGVGFDAVLYLNETCPPSIGQCVGASNHSTSGTSGGKHEFIAASLDAGMTYYVYVDNGSTTNSSGNYVLIVDDALAYEVTEAEPNNVPDSASTVTAPVAGGQLAGPDDEDYWVLEGQEGARVYAWANNGGSSNSTLDTDMGFFAADGSTLIEFDDEDADGANAPIEDLRFIYSTTAPVIAGARFTSDASHYLHVTKQNATGTVHRYRMHAGVQPAGREPLAECEPNNSIFEADRTGKNYFSGVIPSTDDADFYAVDAVAGDRVFIALDGDPERDSDGSMSGNSDPRAFHAKLVIYDPAGDVLISDASDSNSAQDDVAPDYPAQGAFFTARSTGPHYIEVRAQSSASNVGPEETYHLAIFRNNAAPDLTEDVDPVIVTTLDTENEILNITAMDDQPGDSGVCGAMLGAAVNLQITNVTFSPGDPTADFAIELIDSQQGGSAKLFVTDCEGNTACRVVKIDIDAPQCQGVVFSDRSPTSTHGPIHVPDNTPAGINGTIEMSDAGVISDVNVTITIETIRPPDVDCFLESPSGTRVELITDRGSSLEFDILDATFDDDAEEIMPIFSSDAPYTGTWLPEDADGLAQLNGEQAQGTWLLNVIDDSSSANGGSRLREWTLSVQAEFPGPQTYSGTAVDSGPFDTGIESIELEPGAMNLLLTIAPGFAPGDSNVLFAVELVDSTLPGSGSVTVTDVAANTCTVNLNLNGFADGAAPTNTGEVTRDLAIQQEVQGDVPAEQSVQKRITVSDSFIVEEVEASLTIDTKNVGRLASTVMHDGEFASLINRVGMDTRDSVGLTKDNIEIQLDDDAAVEDDAHLEPALGTIEFFGLHQPDGRGEFIGNGITSDSRENMLANLAGLNAAGDWDILVGDFRFGFPSGVRTTFRRWELILKTTCGPERYFGTARDTAPQSGICSIALAPGATNLTVTADFEAGDHDVDYRVTLTNQAQPGNGMLEISDCAGNTNTVAITLTPAACPCDVNCDGSLNSTDFFDFLQAFDLGNADFDGSGSTNSADLFGFLECFSGGC